MKIQEESMFREMTLLFRLSLLQSSVHTDYISQGKHTNTHKQLKSELFMSWLMAGENPSKNTKKVRCNNGVKNY